MEKAYTVGNGQRGVTVNVQVSAHRPELQERVAQAFLEGGRKIMDDLFQPYHNNLAWWEVPIPEGMKFVRYDHTVRHGEYYISPVSGATVGGYAITAHKATSPLIILTPNNVYNLPLEDVKVPEGYEVVRGEDGGITYRPPKKDEYCIGLNIQGDLLTYQAPSDFRDSEPRIIIRPVKPKRVVFTQVNTAPRVPEVGEFVENIGSYRGQIRMLEVKHPQYEPHTKIYRRTEE